MAVLQGGPKGHTVTGVRCKDRLAGKLAMDFDTARRLFTLVCVLHWRG